MSLRERLDTPMGRRVLFFSLYLSEGAPIGYIWLALPTRLRALGLPVEQITALTSLLVLPWTFKFLAAPLIDGLRAPRWGRRHFVVGAQLLMGATLLATLGVDPVEELGLLTAILFAHACAAATQDVAIDALCITATAEQERGSLNGWMQAGMLAGRAAMGGGALILADAIGSRAVVFVLVLLTTFSIGLVLLSGALEPAPQGEGAARTKAMLAELWGALRERRTWMGIGIALLGGAAFKALEVVLGPLLIDHGYSEAEVGWFSAGPMIAVMTLGALLGGALADRVRRVPFVAAALVFVVVAVAAFGAADLALGAHGGALLLSLLTVCALAIGIYTASSYAMFMDLTRPAIAATQFSAFMGATNGCEAWSVWAMGRLHQDHGYAQALLLLCAVSLLALPLLWGSHKTRGELAAASA